MTSIDTCRACGSGNMLCYLRLGDHPAANAFVRAETASEPDQRYPLDTHVCLNCALIQVADPLPSDFYVDYVYVPSASATMPLHFRALAKRFASEFAAGATDLVIDIGCNDGLLLAACLDEGKRALGIDPSANITQLAKGKGVEVVTRYFTPEMAREVRAERGPAKVIVTTNTLNHIDDLHAFMEGVDILLADDGTFVVEVPQALTCVLDNEFDTVYHEHLSVFSAASMAAIGAPLGMKIADLEPLPIHGGSMRFFMRRGAESSAGVRDFLARERSAGLFERNTYLEHAKRVEEIKTELTGLLRTLKADGKRIAGYGAPAKGNTLLNYFGIGPDDLDFIADRNALKHGRLTPGSRIPVVSPDRIESDRPDYLLMLAWNFRDEILEQQAPYRSQGGKFIVPIPSVEIV